MQKVELQEDSGSSNNGKSRRERLLSWLLGYVDQVARQCDARWHFQIGTGAGKSTIQELPDGRTIAQSILVLIRPGNAASHCWRKRKGLAPKLAQNFIDFEAESKRDKWQELEKDLLEIEGLVMVQRQLIWNRIEAGVSLEKWGKCSASIFLPVSWPSATCWYFKKSNHSTSSCASPKIAFDISFWSLQKLFEWGSGH